MKILYTFFVILSLLPEALCQVSAVPDTMTLIFMGDIMGHDTQIESAYDSISDTYNYESVFGKVSPLLKRADFAIANLECTLAGKPYTGYPRFSSPDELASACINSGINVLMTANNHSCDRGKTGIIRTLNVLEFLGIKHTGTFRDGTDRDSSNLLILTKGNLRAGLLNYTYGTNGLPVPSPTVVNLTDTTFMKKDIENALAAHLDKLLVMLHWGQEYQSQPTKQQEMLAEFLFAHGVDAIIGSHPHVIQPMEYLPAEGELQERLVVYSLGNFVSNQRKRKTDGGAMVEITLTKNGGQTALQNYGYHLTWVHKFTLDGSLKFEVLPCLQVEKNGFTGLDEFSRKKMKLFLEDSRNLLEKNNRGIFELTETK
ncbi:MAG: CapA family protein [Chlorobi bacterium]|nr:CapA family protein [Chlorobiota bacterium]